MILSKIIRENFCPEAKFLPQIILSKIYTRRFLKAHGFISQENRQNQMNPKEHHRQT